MTFNLRVWPETQSDDPNTPTREYHACVTRDVFTDTEPGRACTNCQKKKYKPLKNLGNDETEGVSKHFRCFVPESGARKM